MLAGLLFATTDADDDPHRLVATLPFAGHTLIEFQARLLIAAGASQIAIVVARLTPELIGAINRITRRGIAVDAVRSAAEAVEKLHPLARILVLADGVISTTAVVAPLTGEGDDLLLVTTDTTQAGLERVGRDALWAGVARVRPGRLAEVAALPRDYDVQSTLLRVMAQAGVAQVPLGAGAQSAGHGVERRADRVERRSNDVLAAYAGSRPAWDERYLIAPGARALLPVLARRGVSTALVLGVAGGGIALGLLVMALGWQVAGLILVWLGIAGCAIGRALAWVRDEAVLLRASHGVTLGGAAASVMALATIASQAEGSAAAVIAGGALVILTALTERAATEASRGRWWASGAAMPLLLAPFVAIGWPLAGLLVQGGYAAITLAAAIERLREKP